MATRGRKPGTPKTGGRKAGTPNHATVEVKSLARQHGADVIARLAKIALESTNEVAAISAGREILDRGFGKAIQMISGPDEGPIPLDNRLDLSGLSVEQLRALASIKV